MKTFDLTIDSPFHDYQPRRIYMWEEDIGFMQLQAQAGNSDEKIVIKLEMAGLVESENYYQIPKLVCDILLKDQRWEGKNNGWPFPLAWKAEFDYEDAGKIDVYLKDLFADFKKEKVA